MAGSSQGPIKRQSTGLCVRHAQSSPDSPTVTATGHTAPAWAQPPSSEIPWASDVPESMRLFPSKGGEARPDSGRAGGGREAKRQRTDGTEGHSEGCSGQRPRRTRDETLVMGSRDVVLRLEGWEMPAVAPQ